MNTPWVRIHKAAIAVALAGTLGLVAGTASATVFNDFQVSEGSVPSALTNTFTADKITGNYTEVISFTPTSATTGTFTVSLKWQAGEFAAGCNSSCNIVTPTQLNGLGANNYGLYALYMSSGSFSTTGAVTTFTDTSGSGSLNVFIDPNENTTFTPPASGSNPWVTGNVVDDYLIASGTPLGGTGTLDPTLPTCGTSGINCGSFGTTTSFLLTSTVPGGTSYFTLPVPCYNLSFQSGQLNNFTVSGTNTINGSLDVVFSTPEPATLALLGVSLLGLAAIGRRRDQT